MIRRAAVLLCCALAAGPALAATMKLERDRLVNLESPDTVGFLGVRFDFQHNFKDYTLLPVADLTLIFGVWDNVQLEAEALIHNMDTGSFNGHRMVFQYNVTEYGIKWAILDQTKEDWFSLAVGGALGRSDIKLKIFTPSYETLGFNPFKYHMLHRSAYAIATYDMPWITPYVGVRWVELLDSRGGGPEANTGGNGWNYWTEEYDRVYTTSRVKQVQGVTTPGLGLRIKVVEGRDAHVHLMGDFQFQSFNTSTTANAWGAGMQFMWKSPHVYSMYVGNTHGDTAPESVYGGRSTDPNRKHKQELFYTFRWSYRF